ncbi:MAG: GT4 family glycosyltransferase PelF [Magnetococcus sp. WYHC-3]
MSRAPQATRKRSAAETQEVDICMVVEGTYPYVAGGVSSWVHDIIRSHPDLNFHLLAILPPQQKLNLRYELPANVKGLTHVVFNRLPRGASRLPRQQEFFRRLEAALMAFQSQGGTVPLAEVIALLAPVRHLLGQELLLDSRSAWDMLCRMYETLLPGGPFLDFFWTWRFLVGNMMTLLLAPLPRARVYHTVSTGYAGLYAARAHLETGRPALVSEHGIYTNERRIEIAMADWLYETPQDGMNVDANIHDIRSLWVGAFQCYSLSCYQACSEIITLYSGNQAFQRADGADPERMRVIPNGIRWQDFDGIRRSGDARPTMALIGRVVPIKDVKSFLRAAAVVRERVPDLRVLVMGPTEEDLVYFRECRELTAHLGLEGVVTYTGRVKLSESLAEVDVNVLSSISEGQPLVILEAGAAGIPTVATDVGGCRELIEGRPGESPALGSGGAVVPVANPHALAGAVAELLANPALREARGQSMRARVQAHYDLVQMKSAYQDIYLRLRALPDVRDMREE